MCNFVISTSKGDKERLLRDSVCVCVYAPVHLKLSCCYEFKLEHCTFKILNIILQLTKKTAIE